MHTDIISYYAQRALEYEKVYHKPERQEDLARLSAVLKDIFTGKELLEIACGTGYWTERIAAIAQHIHATDINASVIEVAKSKLYPRSNVTFDIADIYTPVTKKHENLFGGFIWSHIPLQQLPGFLLNCCKAVKPGGTIVFTDNNYVEGSNWKVTSTDEHGNTYQTRALENGSQYLVLKNFPTEKEIETLLKPIATDIKFTQLKYYWLVKFKIS